jgi:hypothetical protein
MQAALWQIPRFFVALRVAECFFGATTEIDKIETPVG